MSFPRTAIAVICAVLLASSTIHAHADSDSSVAFDPLVRVHLAAFYDGSTALAVANTGGFKIVKPGGAEAEVVAPGLVVAITSQHGQSAASTAGSVMIQPGESVNLIPEATGTQAFRIARQTSPAHHYRGSIAIECLTSGKLRVIDSLPLEQYLYGVVGPEIGADAPIEALKAQAIAARTFAVKNFDTNEAGDADLEDTTNSQIYLGYDAERWAVRTAVDETAGKILTYDEQPIDAVYATDCGGMTAQGDEPYLKPVVDEDCGSAPPWTVTIPLSGMLAGLERVGVKGLIEIGAVTVHDRDDSGRAATLSVTDAAGGVGVIVPGEEFRRAVGYDKLRSTLFDVKVDSIAQTCTFTGHGWGHGLGMCQNGAIFMARSGAATCEQILTHYYTGVEITDLTSDFLQQDGDTSRDQANSWSSKPINADAQTVSFSGRAPLHGS